MDLYEAPALWKGEDAAQLLRCLHSINTCFKDLDDNVYPALRNTIRTQQAVMEICELLFNRCRPITESLPFGIDSGFFKLLSHINSHLDEQYSLQKLLGHFRTVRTDNPQNVLGPFQANAARLCD